MLRKVASQQQVLAARSRMSGMLQALAPEREEPDAALAIHCGGGEPCR
jgi:hypothetical protein